MLSVPKPNTTVKPFSLIFLLLISTLFLTNCNWGPSYIINLSSLTSAVQAPTGLSVVNSLTVQGLTANPSVTVSGVNPNHTVNLFTDSGCSNQIASANAGSSTSVVLTITPALADGVYNFYANQNNGVTSSACSSASVNYIVDTVYSKISFSTNYVRDAETNLSKSFTVNVFPTKPYAVTVNFDLIGSTAVSGTHFNNISAASVVIPAYQSSAVIPYNLTENTLVDGEKYLQINLNQTNSERLQLGEIYQAKNYITDNESVYANAVVGPHI